MFKNKTIKLFLMLGVIFFSLVGVVGCSNSTVNATYIKMSYQKDVVDGQFNIVNNYHDLVALLKNDSPEKYNDAFFETKSLLATEIVETSTGSRSEIEAYKIKTKTLNVYVKTKQFSDDYAIAYWWHLLELSKDEVNKIDSIKIFKDDKEIMNDNKINNSTESENKKFITSKPLTFNGNFSELIGDEIISDIFFSKDEMINEFSKYEIIWNGAPLWANLCDNYFENKVIVAYFYWIGGSNIERNVDSIVIDNDTLEINLFEKNNDPFTLDDLVFFPILLEVNKDDINPVEKILLKTNYN